jgi:hypothetical protein
VRTSRVETGGDFLLLAFDQTSLSAILFVGALFGLAPYQAAQSAQRHRMRILAFPLLHPSAPSHDLFAFFKTHRPPDLTIDANRFASLYLTKELYCSFLVKLCRQEVSYGDWKVRTIRQRYLFIRQAQKQVGAMVDGSFLDSAGTAWRSWAH